LSIFEIEIKNYLQSYKIRKVPMKKVLVSLALLAFLVTGCSEQSSTPVSPDTLEKKPGTSTIVEIASSNPEFSNLVDAVVFADLAGALSTNRQLTVFAPVNAAFDSLAWALGYPDFASVLVPANKALVTNVLLYHVAPGLRYAKNVLAAGKVNTLVEQFAYVQVMNGDAYIGNSTKYAKILSTDLRASNGVIHVINNVIIPQ
jgi:uncharacterized surface protein with fasciclin (FAS1) repeats